MHPEARLVTSDFWHPGSRASLFQSNRRRPRTDNLGGDGSRELERMHVHGSRRDGYL